MLTVLCAFVPRNALRHSASMYEYVPGSMKISSLPRQTTSDRLSAWLCPALPGPSGPASKSTVTSPRLITTSPESSNEREERGLGSTTARLHREEPSNHRATS